MSENELRQALERIERQNVEQAKQIAALRQTIDDNVKWLPLKTAAIESEFNAETLRLWAKRGLIAAKRVGGRWIICKSSLDAHLQRR